MADGLSKQGLVYLCALSWTVSAVLFLWLMRVSWLRVRDRDALQTKFDAERERMGVHMDKSSVALESIALVLAQSRITVPKMRPGEVPQLSIEPTSQAKKVGP